MSTVRQTTIERGRDAPAAGSGVLTPRRLNWHPITTNQHGEILVPDGHWLSEPLLGDRPAGLPALPATPPPAESVRAGRDAGALGEAVAILGCGAQLRHAAALAGLTLATAAIAADTLARQGILVTGTPLRFVDEFAEAAFYRRVPTVTRGLRHGDAARLLAAEGADPGAVCAHLLASEPTGSSDVVARLRSASTYALDRGRVDLAIRYLRRALREMTDLRVRCRLLHELGRAERVARSVQAIEHMREALTLSDRAEDEHASIAVDLCEALVLSGEHKCAASVLKEVGAPQGPGQAPDGSRGASATLRIVLGCEVITPGEADHDVEALIAAAPLSQVPLRWALAGVLALRGEPAKRVRPLLAQCLERTQSDAWDEARCLPVSLALWALTGLDELERADALIAELMSISRARGSVGALAIASSHRAGLRARRGELAGADADLRALIELARRHAISHLVPLALAQAIDAALERPELEPAIDAMAATPAGDESLDGALMREVRGRLALARGDVGRARSELEPAAATYEVLHCHGANAFCCRTALAAALAHHDPDRAFRLAAAELRDGRRSNSPRAIGIALRTLALLDSGPRAMSYLEEAVAVLEPSYARLEHARALVDLGAALRRANRRAAARVPLRSGLDLAERCGATRLRERARVELQATGARPRRAVLSGAAALTTAERRVAGLAVQGMTNPEIAQTLFVTINTVEGHLRHAYQKLSIHSRSQLAAALDE